MSGCVFCLLSLSVCVFIECVLVCLGVCVCVRAGYLYDR